MFENWKFWSLIIFFVLGCSNPEFRRLSDADADVKMKEKSLRIATSLLELQRKGQFEALGDEATASMRALLTPEKQKEVYENLKGMYGDFDSLEYAESWVPTDGTLLKIYRFKGHFSKSKTMPEIRVVMDGEGKLTGLWIKPWKAKIQ
ncbi:DUF3887 domain-containing protein [bacterium]|nr:hypothetical protein [bacterium]MBU3955341.1 DUF3887 domain-containing protein [bacterium]